MRNDELLNELKSVEYDYNAEENHLIEKDQETWLGWFDTTTEKQSIRHYDNNKHLSTWDKVKNEYENWGDVWTWYGDGEYLPSAMMFEGGVVLVCTEEQAKTLKPWLYKHHGILCASSMEFSANNRAIIDRNGNVSIEQINSIFIVDSDDKEKI